MSALDSFLAEVRATCYPPGALDDPSSTEFRHFTALEDLFHDIEAADSPIALDLLEPMRWCVSQKQHTPEQRLIALDRLLKKYNAWKASQ
jgi:hypothetical protein